MERGGEGVTAATLMRAVGLHKNYNGLPRSTMSASMYVAAKSSPCSTTTVRASRPLVEALAGAQLPDSGRIDIDGKAVPFRGPRDAEAAGSGCLHHGPGLVDTLDVPENAFLGRELQVKIFGLLQ
jgi:simple sugar transport system ATP-binding protein